MQEDIRKALVGCAMPQSEDARKKNEALIRQHKKDNPKEFVYYTAQELGNSDLQEAARHLAGVLFKNSVKGGQGTPDGAFWFTFNEEEAKELKRLILEPMSDESHSVRLAACSAVSTVACLELPEKRWPEIIQLLCSICASENPLHKQSALMTLGYICEELDNCELDRESIDLVISALLETIQNKEQPEEIMKIAIEAVLHSLISAEKIFEEGQGGIIIDRVIECVQYNSTEVITKTMMCLAEIIRLYYEFIDNHMSSIKDVTFAVMTQDFDPDAKTLAIEVWCSLCEEELFLKKREPAKCKNYIEYVFSDLLQIMLTLLNSSDIDEDDDSDIWNNSTAAGCCLQLMAQNVGDQIIQDVISFVENKISHNAGWKDKYFGLIALGAILEGPSKDNLMNVLSPAMGAILGLYSDESTKIRQTAAWFFSKVAQSHAELLGTEEFFPKLYEKIIAGLQDETKVACNSATIITELAKSLAPVEGQNRNILSNCYEDLIQHVSNCAYRDDEVKHVYGRSENKITIAGFDALYSLFEYAPPDVEPLLLSSLEHFFGLLKQTTSSDIQRTERVNDMQSFLCVCLQTILNRINSPLGDDVATNLIDLIVACFSSRGEVFEEGFLLLTALCIKFGKIMDNYVEQIGPYIIWALKECDSSDTIKNACGLISDLCTMVESEKIINGFEEYVPLLQKIMTNPKLKREAKLAAVTAIGDTYLVTKERFIPFLDETLKLLSSAAEQCVDVNTNDEELVDYVIKLQGGLIESYTCIIQEVVHSESQTYTMLEPYVPGIIKFCIISIGDKFSPNMARVKEVAGLIGDLASTYQKQEYFPLQEIEEIVKFLSSSSDKEAKGIAEWVISNITAIMQGSN